MQGLLASRVHVLLYTHGLETSPVQLCLNIPCCVYGGNLCFGKCVVIHFSVWAVQTIFPVHPYEPYFPYTQHGMFKRTGLKSNCSLK